MTREQMDLLQPHAKHFQAMVSFIARASDKELAELLEACVATSVSNCAWDTFAAAQYMVREIRTERAIRERREIAAATTDGR